MDYILSLIASVHYEWPIEEKKKKKKEWLVAGKDMKYLGSNSVV